MNYTDSNERMNVMRKTIQTLAVLLALTLMGGVAAGQGTLPAVTDGGGANLSALAGTATLVSVTIKDSGAQDKNLRVLEIGPNYVAFATPDNMRVVYLFSAIKEIRVQEGKIDSKKFTLDETRSLKMEEQQVVNHAHEVVRRIFDTSSDQSLKMLAASLEAANTNKDMRDYLQKLAESNDIQTKLDAAALLYTAGDTETAKKLIPKGIDHGNRKVRATAIKLAGLVNDTESIPKLVNYLQDRLEEISTPAARALGRLGYRDAIPEMFRMLSERSEEKGNAAIFALAKLGGDDIIQQAKNMLTTAEGDTRHRLILLLHELNAPEAKNLLKEEMKNTPTLAPENAILLAREGDWDASQFLVNRLKRRYDDVTDEDRKTLSRNELMLREKTVAYRASAAAALLENDATAISYLQDMLRSDDMPLRNTVCGLIMKYGKRRMITILQPTIEMASQTAVPASGSSTSQAPELTVLSACQAAISIANPDYRKRALELNDLK